jgi:hypothetical protein
LAGVANVAGVKYYCKIATVTMKEGAQLEESVATAALKLAGFGVKSFESGKGVMVGMARLRIDSFEPSNREAIVKAAQKAVRGAAFVSVDDGGSLVLVMKSGAAPEAKELGEALADAETKIVAKDVEVSEISIAYQRYGVELSAVADAAKTLAAVRGVDGVIAATVDASAKKLDLVTAEPCAKLEEKLGKALEPVAAKVVKVESL